MTSNTNHLESKIQDNEIIAKYNAMPDLSRSSIGEDTKFTFKLIGFFMSFILSLVLGRLVFGDVFVYLIPMFLVIICVCIRIFKEEFHRWLNGI